MKFLSKAHSHCLVCFLHYSILKFMGDDNFTDEKLAASQEKAILFIVGLFKDKVVQQHAAKSAEEPVGAPLGVAQDVDATVPPASAPASVVAVDGFDEDDEMFLSVLKEAGAGSVPAQGMTLESMLEDLKKKVTDEFKSYVQCCKQMVWKEVLAKHGTEKYYKLLATKAVNEQSLNVNPRYTRTMFDVIGWWRFTGHRLFPRLAVAALIVLAKAAHNGYQERVFSIGTFLDTKQQKRREARHYEMDVLQRINNELMHEDEYWEGLSEKPVDLNDKAVAEHFFSITEQEQVLQASTSGQDQESQMEEEPLDSGLKNDEDEVSVHEVVSVDDGEEDSIVPYVDIVDSDDESDA